MYVYVHYQHKLLKSIKISVSYLYHVKSRPVELPSLCICKCYQQLVSV